MDNHCLVRTMERSLSKLCPSLAKHLSLIRGRIVKPTAFVDGFIRGRFLAAKGLVVEMATFGVISQFYVACVTPCRTQCRTSSPVASGHIV
jgi:hypothetical protein